jgi:hypothetical protein
LFKNWNSPIKINGIEGEDKAGGESIKVGHMRKKARREVRKNVRIPFLFPLILIPITEELCFIFTPVFALTMFEEKPEKGGFREELSFRRKSGKKGREGKRDKGRSRVKGGGRKDRNLVLGRHIPSNEKLSRKILVFQIIEKKNDS